MIMAYKSHPENRHTCDICKQPGVMHTAAGLPFGRHERGRRHREAVEARGRTIVASQPLRDAYRDATIRAERPEATSADHTAWLAAQDAFYKAGGRDPANGGQPLPPEVREALTRVSEEAAAWLVKYGHFDRIDRDPSRYCVDNWRGHSDSVAHALGRPLTPDETTALEACIRARLGECHEAAS
jgi:hypothetical protein